MIEGKWGFPKIYEKYYKKYSYLKHKKFNLIKSSLLLSTDNSNFITNSLNINLKSELNINNYLYLKYILNLSKINYLNINNYSCLNNLFKFKKNYKLPILFIKNIKKRRYLKRDFDDKEKIYFRKKYKMSINSIGLLNFYKRKNTIKNLIHKMYFLLKKKKWRINFDFENEIFLWSVK